MTRKIFRVLAVIFLTMTFLIRLLHETQEYETEDYTAEVAECEEYSEDDSVSLERKHFRSWTKYSHDSVYCTSYSLTYYDNDGARAKRTSLRPGGNDGYANYWGRVYAHLYTESKDALHFIKDSLETIASARDLSGTELAKMIVSFVQDIPYNYVMPGPCKYNDHPCLPDEKFGILSPVEFLFTLSGDCDTRSVLLYALLRNMGFSPLIMISNEYGHAMIAVDIPATGDYIEYKGRRFYFWETTNVGWLPGMLPPDSNNVNYWEISLDHEYTPFTVSAD